MSIKFILFYVITVFIASITPGPSMLLALNHGIKYGVRRTMASALGNGVATLIQALLSITGLGAILHQSAIVFQIIKYLGAAYLVYIGITTFLSANRNLNITAEPRECAAGPGKKRNRPIDLFNEAFFVTVGNPKAIIFFTALFPQFINTRREPFLQSCVIVCLLLVIAFLCMMIYGYFGQKAQYLLQKASVLKAFYRIVGGSFVGIGIGLATGKIEN